tara:strand:- start:104 stop:1426 length:1323 start_codon:yes stop_codon:yes gene_type:complete
MLGFKGYLSEASMDKAQLLKRDNVNILKSAIADGTPLDTSKGKTKLTFINDIDRIAFESGDLDTAFYDNKRFKKVFRTEEGEEITLKDVTKTSMFGGGRGSGGGAENTDITECMQCVYCSEMQSGVKPEDIDFKALKSKDFEIDTQLSKIEAALDDSWIESSTLIAELMKKKMSGKFTYHKGSPLVKDIEGKFKELNRKEKAFSNINKWSPADIWAVKKGYTPNFSQFETLGEFNNHFKEMYDAKNLVGISLKKAKGSVPFGEYNITGFIRRPVTFGGYTLYTRDFFNSKDMYFQMKGAGNIQLRTFGNFQFQGEVKGRTAAAGKIGGGIILAILEKITGISNKLSAKQVKALASKPTPQFLQEFYELYLSLETKKKMEQEEFNKLLDKEKPDFLYSKYWAMFIVSSMINSRKQNEVCDAIAGYASASSDLSGPYAKYGD